MIKRLTIFIIAAALALCACDAKTGQIDVPGPPPSGGDNGGNNNEGNGNNEGNENGGNENGNGESADIPGAVHCTDIGQEPIVLAYYTENSTKLPDVTLLTHINYAHGRFNDPTNGSGGIWIDKPELMQKVIALKSKNPKLKVMLMIGGWGMKADGFSMMARDPGKRTEFCQSVKKHLDTYGLDGVDIDWEFPTRSAEGTGASPADTKNFNLVLKELRETIGTDKIISFASHYDGEYVDWSEAMKYLDYVNVMTYDMGAAPEKHNSPLYRSTKFNQHGCDDGIEMHLKKGVPLKRMNLGVPFYGKAEKNGTVYDYTVNYYEMASILEKGWYEKRSKDVKGYNKRVWDDVAKVPFLIDAAGKNYLSYDDPESVTCKGEYVQSKGLLGAMCWEYRLDDSNQSLLKALVKAIYGKETVIQ